MTTRQFEKAPLWRPELEHDSCGVGIIVHTGNKRSKQLVDDALGILNRLAHRGGAGADPETGDGAGILLQLTDRLFRAKVDFPLPEPGHYAVAQVFFARDRALMDAQKNIFVKTAEERGFSIIGWRSVPVRLFACGAGARVNVPEVMQAFLTPADSSDESERALYMLRRSIEKAAEAAGCAENFYICSLSARTIVYKGMLHARQLPLFYPDLNDPDIEASFALVHSRYSTNTLPSWDRAQPCRMLAHNGEINTLRGVENAIAASENDFSFGGHAEMKQALPIISGNGSDSMKLDNLLELLVRSGRPVEQALPLLLQGAWSEKSGIERGLRDFYEYAACLTTPWDGPAALGFTDGEKIGAALDRNGLRPARWMLTKSGVLVLASEAGVLDVPPSEVVRKGRLGPGQIILFDMRTGKLTEDREIKKKLSQGEFRKWLLANRIRAQKAGAPAEEMRDAEKLQRLFGYTFEDLYVNIKQMAETGSEPIGSMGYDSPLAVLSENPQPLYNYFKQLFAQVTNPPIDAIREECVTGTDIHLGRKGDLTQDKPENCRRIALQDPILDRGAYNWLLSGSHGFTHAKIDICFTAEEGVAAALERIFAQAEAHIAAGSELLVLTDESASAKNIPLPALLAASGLHQHLIRKGIRGRCSILLDSFEPREVHHFACLVGYGVEAIYPRGAYVTIRDMCARGLIATSADEAEENFRHAVVHGLLKVISKMGISAVSGYLGAQVFEAVGLSDEVIDKYFTGTVSRLGGMTTADLEAETLKRHRLAFHPAEGLPSGGRFQYKFDGEAHLYSPQAIHTLQTAVRTGDYALFKQYVKLIESQKPVTIRSLLGFKPGKSIPLNEVEPVENIVRRFKTGAMSYGSISREAHKCLAEAMNTLGGRSNSGEGGEEESRLFTIFNSGIKQIASGRFGVTGRYLASASEIQIKMAQGAKPGEGGQLPGNKVYPDIARTRHSTAGVGLISPPPHHDIYSIEDLAQLIYDLKRANPKAAINVKLVSETGVGTVAAGVAKGGADVILISGYDGGTGASPRTSIQHTGLPWEIGLSEAHQILTANGLRGRVRLETDGKLLTGRDVAIAALMGAEEFGFATLPLIAMGCVMMRVCNLDTCPVGIATQSPELRARFSGKPEHVITLMRFIAEDLREIMAELGFRTVDDMVGRAASLVQTVRPKKAEGFDVSPLISYDLPLPLRDLKPTDSDEQLFMDMVHSFVQSGGANVLRSINNTERAAGTRIGYFVSHDYEDMPDGKLTFRFTGTAGQSFAAFVPRGMEMTLIGEANDYLGKGLSGGRIIIFAPPDAGWDENDNLLAGNVVLYGATSGELYLAGRAGERFAVRNSGATAVCEGVGHHGLEYMTGGVVAILGPVGHNFAAGMSGGIAYVYDDGEFEKKCNLETVGLYPLDSSDIVRLHGLISRHRELTGSKVAARILENWVETACKFIKVLPHDYREIQEAMKIAAAEGCSGEDMIVRAFELKTGRR